MNLHLALLATGFQNGLLEELKEIAFDDRISRVSRARPTVAIATKEPR